MISLFSVIIRLFAGCFSSKLESLRIPPGSRKITFIQQLIEFEDNFLIVTKQRADMVDPAVNWKTSPPGFAVPVIKRWSQFPLASGLALGLALTYRMGQKWHFCLNIERPCSFFLALGKTALRPRDREAVLFYWRMRHKTLFYHVFCVNSFLTRL